jgi:hypothetical protein
LERSLEFAATSHFLTAGGIRSIGPKLKSGFGNPMLNRNAAAAV